MSERVMRPSELLQQRRDDVLRVIAAHNVTNPRIFGSVARREDNADSDIDIVVNVPKGSAWNFISLKPALSQLLGIDVDVVSEGGLTPKHSDILKEAVPL